MSRSFHSSNSRYLFNYCNCKDGRFGSYDVLATQLTNCLRVIRNAWHFHYALRLVFKVVYGSIGIALLTP
ncbi:DUF3265 domain-containing protein [Vibrio vulnificus]|nr:DUF3265 domain-containing protein [Vibrio vulnificus]